MDSILDSHFWPKQSWKFFPRFLRSDFIHWVIVLPIILFRASPIPMGCSPVFFFSIRTHLDLRERGFRAFSGLIFEMSWRLFVHEDWFPVNYLAVDCSFFIFYFRCGV